jgi:hypothetical protein
MKIDKLKPGMLVYSVGRRRMGNTTINTTSVWSVYIVAVDTAKGVVLARWNYNPPQRFNANVWSKWRLKKPLLVGGPFGSYRLATRAEIEAKKNESGASKATVDG